MSLEKGDCQEPMIAIQNAHASGPSCSNQLMNANQIAHAFGPSSTVVRMKMKAKSVRSYVGGGLDFSR